MELFETRRTKILRLCKTLIPVLFAVLLCTAFLWLLAHTSQDTLAREQATLSQALEKGAIHTYAMTGRYPESLEELMSSSHITYDHEKFVVEYLPNGSNLLPSIQVIVLKDKRVHPLTRKGGDAS